MDSCSLWRQAASSLTADSLWRQAAGGPRTGLVHPDGLSLWRRQLRFLALYARHPATPSARTAVLPYAAAAAEVESFVRRLVWWLLHGPADRCAAVLEARRRINSESHGEFIVSSWRINAPEALRLAHTALLPETIRQLRAVAAERAEAPRRSGS